MQTRRSFLKRFTLLSTSACAPTFLVRSIKAARTQGMANAELGNPNRILVVVELSGGGDGLNTVIPYADPNYYAARPGLALQPADVLKLDERVALHPSMTGFKDLWDNGLLSLVQGVGYPNPNRSHFRSRDIWYTAEPEKASSDGWLARYFDLTESKSSLQGINVGGKVSRAMVSESGSSPSIQNIATYQIQTDPKYPRDEANKIGAFQRMLSEPHDRFPFQEYVSETVLDATLSSVQLLEGKESYHSTIDYPNTAFATNLRTIAQIVAADIGVTVFYTSISGFDTHANQVVGDNNRLGSHAGLLEDVSQGIKAFYDDMVEMGRGQDVLVVSFSEFGRRLTENGSLGTDHGTANQMFLVGGSLNPGLYGRHPGLEADQLDEIGDMVYQVDFRSVYATLLAHWLGTDPNPILGADWPLLSFV
ncbi:MAG: DUF1501 domain-containing protein [Acidobacteriota bacterium]